MKIGIVGVPGSGKTQLAHDLRGPLNEIDFPSGLIIDGYTGKVEDEEDLAIGYLGGYLANLAIAMEREKQERKIDKNGLTRITCGTILETICYLSLYGGTLSRSDPLYHQKYTRLEVTLPFFGMLTVDFLRYDRLLVLTDPNEQEHAALQNQILLALQEWHVPYAMLERGENRVPQALKILKEDFEATQTNQQSV
jgi:hypothetical protein